MTERDIQPGATEIIALGLQDRDAEVHLSSANGSLQDVFVTDFQLSNISYQGGLLDASTWRGSVVAGKTATISIRNAGERANRVRVSMVTTRA